MAVSSTLPVRSTIATFTPVRRPGSRPIVARGPGGRGEQQVVQIAGEDADRLFFRTLAQRGQQLGFELPRELDLPRPAHRLQQPGVGRAACDRRC